MPVPAHPAPAARAQGAGAPHDLLLSSGYLAFARHAGVLRALEAHGPPVDAVVGTSSGALVGALWSAGMSADAIGALLASRAPWTLLRPHARPWRGVFSLGPLRALLRAHLPARFDQLPRPFAAGVIDADRRPRLLTDGDLPDAVLASCAIPWLFAWVEFEGARFQDGGVADRLMLDAWRAWRGDRPVLVHLVDRSAGRDPGTPLDGLAVVRTPRSGASFWSLGDVAAGMRLAEERALAVLDEARPAGRRGAGYTAAASETG